MSSIVNYYIILFANIARKKCSGLSRRRLHATSTLWWTNRNPGDHPRSASSSRLCLRTARDRVRPLRYASLDARSTRFSERATSYFIVPAGVSDRTSRNGQVYSRYENKTLLPHEMKSQPISLVVRYIFDFKDWNASL